MQAVEGMKEEEKKDESAINSEGIFLTLKVSWVSFKVNVVSDGVDGATERIFSRLSGSN